MKKNSWLNRNILAMGLTSFFNDVASEMIYPVVPVFLTSVLGVPVMIVGLIEGIAESTASILKIVSGWLSDKYRKRFPFVVAGYSFSSISKILLGLAYSWPFVLFARFIDRFGKGVRTSARDALISESSSAQNRGKSFGFHRALDTMGAVVGPLISLLAIKFLDGNYRLIFFLAFIPSVIGVLLLILFVKEKEKDKSSDSYNLAWNNFGANFKIFLLISFIFALGNSSDAFLILRSQNLGLPLTLTIFAYVLFNFSYAVFSVPAGSISDRIGSKKVLLAGYLLFATVYLSFGIIKSSAFLWVLFPVYGIYMALTEGVSKAYISNLIPHEKIGTAYGVYQTTVGLTTFLASLLAGFLWTFLGVSSPFIFGGVMAIFSALLFIKLKENK